MIPEGWIVALVVNGWALYSKHVGSAASVDTLFLVGFVSGSVGASCSYSVVGDERKAVPGGHLGSVLDVSVALVFDVKKEAVNLGLDGGTSKFLSEGSFLVFPIQNKFLSGASSYMNSLFYSFRFYYTVDIFF